jgi:drug/metabolite transporter (DMT)-like permease
LKQNPRHAHALRGIGLMILAVSTFSCLDATAKYLAAIYAVPTIVWARYVFQMLLMVGVLGPRLRMQLVRTAHLRLQLIRGAVLTASSLLFLTALSRMPLAEAASIAFMAPLFIAVLSGPVLHERVEGRTWVALAAGFAGVLLIVRPGGALFTWVALLPLGSAFLMAVYQMMTRRLAGRDAALTTLFYPALVGSVVVPIVFPLALTVPHQPAHIAMFCALGVMGGIGHFFLIRAHDHAPASVLGPFMYGQLLTALVLGWLVFGQLPDAIAVLGMVVIAASGLLLAFSHRRG